MAIHDNTRAANSRKGKDDSRPRRGDMDARTLARIRAAATIARLRQEALYDRLADHFRSAFEKGADRSRASMGVAAERAREHLTAAGIVTEQQGRRLKAFLVRDVDRIASGSHTDIETSYRTGEITDAGILTCVHCKAPLHLPRTVTVPPCPKCSATEFRKSYRAGGCGNP